MALKAIYEGNVPQHCPYGPPPPHSCAAYSAHRAAAGLPFCGYAFTGSEPPERCRNAPYRLPLKPLAELP